MVLYLKNLDATVKRAFEVRFSSKDITARSLSESKVVIDLSTVPVNSVKKDRLCFNCLGSLIVKTFIGRDVK